MKYSKETGYSVFVLVEKTEFGIKQNVTTELLPALLLEETGNRVYNTIRQCEMVIDELLEENKGAIFTILPVYYNKQINVEVNVSEYKHSEKIEWQEAKI